MLETNQNKGIVFYASVPGHPEKKVAAWQPGGNGGGNLYKAKHPHTAPFGYSFPKGTLYSTIHKTVVSWAKEIWAVRAGNSPVPPIRIREKSRHLSAKEAPHGKSIH